MKSACTSADDNGNANANGPSDCDDNANGNVNGPCGCSTARLTCSPRLRNTENSQNRSKIALVERMGCKRSWLNARAKGRSTADSVSRSGKGRCDELGATCFEWDDMEDEEEGW